jgi:hypothetical protein
MVLVPPTDKCEIRGSTSTRRLDFVPASTFSSLNERAILPCLLPRLPLPLSLALSLSRRPTIYRNTTSFPPSSHSPLQYPSSPAFLPQLSSCSLPARLSSLSFFLPEHNHGLRIRHCLPGERCRRRVRALRPQQLARRCHRLRGFANRL